MTIIISSHAELKVHDLLGVEMYSILLPDEVVVTSHTKPTLEKKQRHLYTYSDTVAAERKFHKVPDEAREMVWPWRDEDDMKEVLWEWVEITVPTPE